MSVVNIVVKVFHIWHSDPYMDSNARIYIRCHGGQETIFKYEIDREGRNRYCNTYFVSPLLKNCNRHDITVILLKVALNAIILIIKIVGNNKL